MLSLEPLDIWRGAKVMVEKHGDQAPLECAMMADKMLDHGDLDGQAVWLAIRRAVKSLLEHGPPTDIDKA
jgi:hypothetical protein